MCDAVIAAVPLLPLPGFLIISGGLKLMYETTAVVRLRSGFGFALFFQRLCFSAP